MGPGAASIRPSAERLKTLAECVGLAVLAALAVPWGDAVGRGVDLWGTLWFFEWTAHAVGSFENPFISTWSYWPEGEDLFREAGGNQLDALIAAPLVALFGTPGWMAPWCALVLFGNAVAMRASVRGLGGSRPAALVAAVVFAASPFVWTELAFGRPTQALLWFLPLAVWMLRTQDQAWWRAPAGGVLLAAQAWTYWFTGHLSLLVLGPALLVFAYRWGPAAWYRLGQGAGACLLLVGPAVAWMLIGGVEGVDIASPERMGWWILAPSQGPMAVGVWGLVLLAIALSRARLAWALAAVLAILLAAGPELAFRGGVVVSNPVWFVAGLLPGWERFHYPYRAVSVLGLVAGFALAEAIDRLPRWRWASLVALPAVLWHWSPLPTTPVEEPEYASVIRAEPGVVLDLPWLCSVDAVHLQVFHRQPSLGAMTENVSDYVPVGHAQLVDMDPILGPITRLSRGETPGELGVQQVREVGWVVLHRELMAPPVLHGRGCPAVDQRQVERTLTEWLGEPVSDDGRRALYSLR